MIGGRWRGVPGANLLADIAPEHPPVEQRLRRRRDLAAVLDRPVADAQVAAQPVGPDQRPGRTSLEAPRAAPAQVGERQVGRQVEREQQLADQKPRTAVRVQEHCVLTERPETGARRELALEDRTGVDVGPGGAAGEGTLDALAEAR